MGNRSSSASKITSRNFKDQVPQATITLKDNVTKQNTKDKYSFVIKIEVIHYIVKYSLYRQLKALQRI